MNGEMHLATTKEKLQASAKEYLIASYGKPGQGNDADKWMEKFGLMCGFIDELFETKPSERKL